MKVTLRRTLTALAAGATALTGAVAVAPPATASGAAAAQACIDQLSGPAAGTDRLIVYPAEKAEVRLTTSLFTGDTCRSYAVSLGLSRTDLSGYLSANASGLYWGGGPKMFSARFVLPPNQPGTWMTRQIAVKGLDGVVHVRQFTAATSPTKIAYKRESFLTGTPHGSAITHTYLSTRLQAWSTVGTMANLGNQEVLLQVSRPGANAYTTILRGRGDRFGIWRTFVSWKGYSGYDVRLAYYSPYQTIASDWHYLGRIA
jgi:hypothetical protein